MPASVGQTSIPVPNNDNLVMVVAAIRNALIAASNTSAGRSDARGTVQPQNPALGQKRSASQFIVTNQVVVPVTYSIPDPSGTGPAVAAVTIPQVQSIVWSNQVTGETILWTAPGKLFSGGTIGTAL